mgnify:CR=1 FL=1
MLNIAPKSNSVFDYDLGKCKYTSESCSDGFVNDGPDCVSQYEPFDFSCKYTPRIKSTYDNSYKACFFKHDDVDSFEEHINNDFAKYSNVNGIKERTKAYISYAPIIWEKCKYKKCPNCVIKPGTTTTCIDKNVKSSSTNNIDDNIFTQDIQNNYCQNQCNKYDTARNMLSKCTKNPTIYSDYIQISCQNSIDIKNRLTTEKTELDSELNIKIDDYDTKLKEYFEDKPERGFYIFSRAHEVHYLTAYKMYLDRPFVGQGPNMFRKKCSDENIFGQNMFQPKDSPSVSPKVEAKGEGSAGSGRSGAPPSPSDVPPSSVRISV